MTFQQKKTISQEGTCLMLKIEFVQKYFYPSESGLQSHKKRTLLSFYGHNLEIYELKFKPSEFFWLTFLVGTIWYWRRRGNFFVVIFTELPSDEICPIWDLILFNTIFFAGFDFCLNFATQITLCVSRFVFTIYLIIGGWKVNF